jgi:hypothetical protein
MSSRRPTAMRAPLRRSIAPGTGDRLALVAHHCTAHPVWRSPLPARMLSQHPVDRTLLHPLLDTCREQLAEAGIRPKLRTVLADSGYSARRISPEPTRTAAAARAAGQRPRPAGRAPAEAGQAPGPVSGHRPRPPLPAPSPRTGRLQVAGADRGTSIRAAQGLPGTDHDVRARFRRMRKRMAARLRRAQSA